MGRAGSWAIGLMAILTVISCASRSDHASQANLSLSTLPERVPAFPDQIP